MSTDIVSVVGLQLSTTVGPDCWNRTRAQPIQLTVHLHLTPHFLDTASQSDNVTDSLHYGQLTKAIERRVGSHEEGSYAGVRTLLEGVMDAAFGFVMEILDAGGDPSVLVPVRAVRVVVVLPKQILLAGNFEAELMMPLTTWAKQQKDQDNQRQQDHRSPFTTPSSISLSRDASTSTRQDKTPSARGGSRSPRSYRCKPARTVVETAGHPAYHVS